MKVGVLFVLFQEKVSFEILIKVRERWAKTTEGKKGLLNISFGEVGFICFLSPTKCFTDLV